MLQTATELALAPALVGVSTWASARWNERLGGVLSAFPAIVGPFLLIDASEHGARFTQQAANGVLAGLVALSGFALAYALAALRRGWRVSLAAGWSAAAILSLMSAGLAATPLLGLLAATITLAGARYALPDRGPALSAGTTQRVGTPLRMALTLALVVALALAADSFGALVGGLLAALPVLASILAASTHREAGAAAALELLRGMLDGMAAFVLFCAAIALLILPAGVAVAFSAGTVLALSAQVLAARAERAPPIRARPSDA